MTAGRGIVHSERTPEEMRAGGSNLHGLQIWLALPHEAEESDPAFVHHPASSIPRIEKPGAKLALVAGSAYGMESPVRAASPMFYVAADLAAEAEISLPDEYAQRAVYVVEGETILDGQELAGGSMAVLREGAHVQLHSGRASSRVVLVGGVPLAGERHLWWNFVSSSRERIERASPTGRTGDSRSYRAKPSSSRFPNANGLTLRTAQVGGRLHTRWTPSATRWTRLAAIRTRTAAFLR